MRLPGIGIACITAQYFDDAPVVFAKKNPTKNIAGEVYTSKVESFTHGRVYNIIVSKRFLGPEDRVLIIDDFLANGCALMGLIDIVRASGAELAGAGIVIEKGFQEGGRIIRGMGVRLESLGHRRIDERGGRSRFSRLTAFSIGCVRPFACWQLEERNF